MRAKEARDIAARLARHQVLMDKYVDEGMEREAASRRAYNEILGKA